MKQLRLESVILAAGIALLGLFIYWGLCNIKGSDRTVTVRGLAEREVKADRVIWPITYNTAGDDLQAIYKDVNTANEKIYNFLLHNGLKPEEMTVSAPAVTDLYADRYSNRQNVGERYRASSTLTVVSTQVDRVRDRMKRMGELLKQGVAISPADYSNAVQYDFTSLNKIKPTMIEEATKNARAAAHKFATDSESSLGKIKSATQGLFSIEDRDQYTPYIKRVRVVTTVEYYLDS